MCFFLQDQTKLKARVHGDDMCLAGKRGVARALESKLKERMLIKVKADTVWTQADDKNISLHNPLIELRVESGERVLRFESDPRRANVKPLSSPGDHEFTSQEEWTKGCSHLGRTRRASLQTAVRTAGL